MTIANDEVKNGDKVLAHATNFLIQGDEYYEASILLLSRVEISTWEEWNERVELEIAVYSSRAVYHILSDPDFENTQRIIEAFNAVLPSGFSVARLTGKVDYTDYNERWREALLEVVEGKRPLNQGIPIKDKPRFTWENLFFRSPVEVKIAEALDQTGVLFLPNCMARLGLPGSRASREADFLVCCEGKWGILEVNGEAFHTSAARDHDRGRLFKMHGIKVFEPYDAKRCIYDPSKVVKEFLEILRRNG